MSASTEPDRSVDIDEHLQDELSASSGMDETKLSNTRNGHFVESIWSRCTKWTVLMLVTLVAGAAGTATFLYTSNNEHESFESKVETLAYEIATNSQDRAENLFAMLNTLAVTLSAHATTTTTSWPFETFPNFEQVVTNYREVTHSRMIASLPAVRDSEKADWEAYANEEQGWIKKSYESIGLPIEPIPIHPNIYNFVDGHATEAHEGPFFPLWQLSPPPRNTGLVNYNVISNENFESALKIAEGKHEALLTQITDLSLLIDDAPDAHESLLVQPVVVDAQDISSQVVASIMASISWDTFFSDIVRAGNKGMHCVLENTCGDKLTWKIDGELAVFEGLGDRHDSAYDEYEYITKLTPFLTTTAENTPGYCEYEIHIFPTSQVEEQFVTKKPQVYTAIIVSVFVGLAICFLIYNHLVQVRQQAAQEQAAKSEALVQSMFPAEVRDRLFKGDKDGEQPTMKERFLDGSKREAQKYRLKNFLDEEGAVSERSTVDKDKPIADLFPNTTVMFADIAGFTAWSSVREPSQVFTLLETVYKAFDKSAKKRKVFKVETVGDCYVAVTGLPEPLEDHAAVMCKFARECVTQFMALVRQLEVLLGPDTGDLAVRVGLHSGPVTAGVLRGDKSRFQLFGDTMNTAARIESTGMRNKIHLSHETAELLHAGGKSNWMVKRTDTVMAKGKGEIQTYWLLSDDEVAAGGVSDDGAKSAAPLPIVKANAARLATGVNMANPEEGLPPKIRRLVDWNVDVLKRLLKQVVAKRQALGNEQMDPNHPLMMKTEVNIGCDTYVLDEVTEIIRLPGYTHAKQAADPSKIELPEEVSRQLRLYVASIAAMHRDNSFHNFEHASHVMMSVSKLLSRIVAPEEILRGEDEGDQMAMSLHDHTYGITSDPLTHFSVVLAALIHDVDHAGVSNFQLIKEGAKIATVFKEKSVAEQNSIVLAWDRLMESRFTALRSHIYGDPNELKRFRQLMVNTVLATDIFDKELQGLRKKRWDTAFRHIDAQSDSTPEDDVNRKATIVIEHLIQASDVAHTMQHWHIYQKWNERLFAEMTVAYQAGRMGSDPAPNWYQGELGFFDNYIIPLAKKLKNCGVFGVSSDEYLNYALENRREWANKGEDVVAQYMKKYCSKEGGNVEQENGEKKDDAKK